MQPPAEVVRLAEARAAARAAKDFARADELRGHIAAAGWGVEDSPDGWRLQPKPTSSDLSHRMPASQVASLLEDDPAFDITVQWLCQGWPEDVDRGIAAFRKDAAPFSVQDMVVDLTGQGSERWGAGVEVLSLEERTGWAAAMNAGLSRSLGRVVVVADSSVEPTGDVLGPLVAALDDPELGVCGPFGLVTADLRRFDESLQAGPCDAVEGYLMALRRETLRTVGLFDQHFRWYRTADIELSFRVRDAGFRAEVVPVPVTRHEHRMWSHTDPAERDRWSKRNFYRFLDRWRDRWDLVLSGPPGDLNDAR